VFLIGTKTKLAPLKQLTVPRLELNAALLLARWLNRIRRTSAAQLNVIGGRAWSDSTIVLSWLTVPHTSFKLNVSNRVHQIRTLLPDCHWQHVESHNNPADCASRVMMPSVLSQYELYWHGPPVAYEDPSVWDQFRPPQYCPDLPEMRTVPCRCVLMSLPMNGAVVFQITIECSVLSHMHGALLQHVVVEFHKD